MLEYIFEEIPTFDDQYADVARRYHSSGALIADIQYGATDKEGNPTYPKNNADGHGRLLVIEVDGKYRTLAWRHSRAEGGNTEAGSVFDNPLSGLEESIRAKRDVIKAARELMTGRTYDTDEAAKILEGYGEDTEYHTPREAELREQYERLCERNNKNKQYFARVDENAAKKKALLDEARGLADSTEWNATAEKLQSLLDQWKKIGNAGEENDSMWEEFSSIRKGFYDRRSSHFEELDKTRKEGRQIKKDLIREARRVAIESPDYGATHKKLEALMEQWKKAGHAGKDESNLWAEFKAVRDEFYGRRDEAYKDRLQEKEDLVKEAEAIAAGGDYSSFVSDRMKELNAEWKRIGYCGKDGDKLWENFHAAQDRFWQGKKEQNAARMSERQDKLQGAIERRREKLAKLEENNDKLKDRLTTTQDEEKKEQISGWIKENEEKIEELKSEISSMEQA